MPRILEAVSVGDNRIGMEANNFFGEPAAPHVVALVSIAVSLKRIADAINSPNAYGEVGSAALAGAISRGLRDR